MYYLAAIVLNFQIEYLFFYIKTINIYFFLLQKKVNPDLQVEVKPSIRARKIQEEKMRKQMQKEEYWRRREEEERWRMEMRYGS